MAALSPSPFLQFFDPVTGAFLEGGKVFTYITGTTTDQETFTDGDGNTPHANPIILDSAGSATIYLTPGAAYKFVIKRDDDTTVDTIDPVVALDSDDIAEIVDEALDEIVLPVANGGTGASTAPGARTNLGIAYPADLIVACSDESTELAAASGVVTFRAPRAMTLSAIHASLSVVSSSGNIEVDVLKNGTTVFSTNLTIDANEKTSRTATVPAALASTAVAADDEFTVNLLEDGTGAKGLKLYLIGTTT